MEGRVELRWTCETYLFGFQTKKILACVGKDPIRTSSSSVPVGCNGTDLKLKIQCLF